MRIALFLLLFSVCFSSFASSRLDMARASALIHAKLTFAHLEDRLELNVISIREVEQQVLVEIGIGTVRRPDRLHSCFIATFDNNGFDYISKLEQKWDEPCQ